jgi:uncharacterized protein YceH (UPF0502 family)
MLELTADEARVIGVLIEKAQTTPDSYPMTINAVVNGANQKNNRHPLTEIDDGAVLSALIGLRNKGLVVQQDGPGQRAPKFRHQFKEGAGVNTPEMVLLAELLLRGPQTLGELRGRASRMYALESLEMVKNVLQQLMNRPEPLVSQVSPAPGSRAERYIQLLSPDLHPLDESAQADSSEIARAPGAAPTTSERITTLEREVQALRAALQKLATEIGASDPLADTQNQTPSIQGRPS